MTHAEAIATNPALEPTGCPGELAELTSYQDRVLEGGQPVERTVELFECHHCHWRVSIAGGKALNHYAMPATGELARVLARSFTVPGNGR